MNPSDAFNPYITVYDAIPPGEEALQDFLVERLREHANGINSRDYAYYVDEQLVTGQQWIPSVNSTEFRTVLRKVVELDGLPNFGVTNPKTVSHGLTFSENTEITRLYGCATEPSATSITLGIPLPYIDISSSNHVGLEIDSTNIIIRGSGDYSAFTKAHVVVEWIDEV